MICVEEKNVKSQGECNLKKKILQTGKMIY